MISRRLLRHPPEPVPVDLPPQGPIEPLAVGDVVVVRAPLPHNRRGGQEYSEIRAVVVTLPAYDLVRVRYLEGGIAGAHGVEPRSRCRKVVPEQGV
jgi:hypothetical protein